MVCGTSRRTADEKHHQQAAISRYHQNHWISRYGSWLVVGLVTRDVLNSNKLVRNPGSGNGQLPSSTSLCCTADGILSYYCTTVCCLCNGVMCDASVARIPSVRSDGWKVFEYSYSTCSILIILVVAFYLVLLVGQFFFIQFFSFLVIFHQTLFP